MTNQPIGTMMMTASELASARQRLETDGWVLTYRQTAYRLPCDAADSLLGECPGFADGAREHQALLKSLTEPPPPTQEDRDLTRRLRRQGLLAQLTQRLAPIGVLRSDDCRSLLTGLVASLADGVEGQQLLADVARRQLRRMERDYARRPLESSGDGNAAPFPLDADLQRQHDCLRLAIHSNPRSFEFHTSSAANSNNSSSSSSSSSSREKPQMKVPTEAELYRPYLNGWLPFDTTVSAIDIEATNQQQTTSVRQQQRLLLGVVVGGLTWRQKQHRQQRLAVRLATRSALIGLKHSICAQPAKNYLDLYVNMISRSVEAASLHVRRWSDQLERSWKTFKELAQA